MTYEEFISDVVKVVEAVGAAIMVVGGFVVLVVYGLAVVRPQTRTGAYQRLRQTLAG